jgi:peptidoglycan/xylan/chitin deacetylase (PgdA/CDA1 family)
VRLPGRRLARRALDWAGSRLTGGVAVLGYHRICDDDHDPLGLATGTDCFDTHVRFLADYCEPMRLQDAATAVRRGRPPPRSVAVTFDDGYIDTLEHALPVLERHGVPATVFVTSGNPGAEFWWDELARMVAAPRPLPPAVDLELPGGRLAWTRPDHAGRGRHALLQSLAAALEPLTGPQRDVAMNELRRVLGRVDGPGRHRSLPVDALRALAASRLVDIGAHTVTHPALAGLPAEEQSREVTQSRAELEEIIGREVRCFSYPHGSHSAHTRRMVQDAGFQLACCSTPGLLTRTADPLAIPRLWVGRQNERDFRRWLKWWLTS